MEGGPADFVLVEEEADRVAKQAVKKLQTSQRECWQAASGIPNFTGNNGARNIFSWVLHIPTNNLLDVQGFWKFFVVKM